MNAAAGRIAGKTLPLAAMAVAGALAFFPPAAGQTRKSIPPKDPANPLSELISGYEFAALDIRALQDDDFDNPGFAWVSRGEALWSRPEGQAGKSCASCHGTASESMRGKAVDYPKFNPGAAAVINLEQRIDLCRRDNMRASPWTYGSDEMLSMSAYLRLQSRGLPMSVRITREAQPVFERGKTLYNTRRGALGISCALCHDKHYGKTFSGKVMSQGQTNGFPTYHRDLQQFLPLHAQFSNCRRRMKAETAEAGSPDYVALELYLAWRGSGLPMEAPSVRR
jgi:sulfur-oxidizing protein SoxA